MTIDRITVGSFWVNDEKIDIALAKATDEQLLAEIRRRGYRVVGP